ncbi:MAG TPA: glycosyl hydrolase family 28-related protein [Steroidobacteraceae bacterium]
MSRKYCTTLALMALCAMTSISVWSEPIIEVDLGQFGAKGDGQTDDSVNVQRALTYCSMRGATCRIPHNSKYLITQPLFLWGNAKLHGDDGSGELVFKAASAPYLLNIGISGKNGLEAIFRGEISNTTFRVIGGSGGRIIYFWRTRNARIEHNAFYVGSYAYSATSSGNDNSWVVNGSSNCVRENINISGNKIYASAGEGGSEGIGVANFNGAIVSDNEVVGVGDDPVGIHFSTHVVVNNNLLKSVHGRAFVANSNDVVISNNTIERMSSSSDHRFYAGIALIYVGFENQDGNSWKAPRSIQIHHNHMHYPPGALDQGAAINLNGVKATTVEENQIINDSPSVMATGLHVSPVLFSGPWSDPEGIEFGSIASVWDVAIERNKSGGKFPQSLIMTGNCVNYKGKVIVQDNVAADFSFYCGSTVFPKDRNIRARETKS